ncbi:uncharacterized protein LOC129942410 isoform X2 [Eupeodes corollae]|uniref:uncharacterized protein LOC129942410 isoform X2 n=1 Tax=Eupeodes corollae TaxID=290404 RepID=UPI002492C496|nr:uncharacterized protein LOC129942410 isoform X2 [Eupeodes corollae]
MCQILNLRTYGMSCSPKWFYKKKETQIEILKILTLIYQKHSYFTKINTELFKVIDLGNYIKVIKEYEGILKSYDVLKEDQQATFSSIKKIKRSPHRTILLTKLRLLSYENKKRFQQLMFFLKEILFFSFRKLSKNDNTPTFGLELVGVYNRCNSVFNKLEINVFNSSICSNTYPNLLLPQSNLKFCAVLQLFSQRIIEKNTLEILLELLNMGGDLNNFEKQTDCSPSSLEALNILTQNIFHENVLLKNNYFAHDTLMEGMNNASIDAIQQKYSEQLSFENIGISNFMNKKRMCITDLILDCRKNVPSVLYEIEEPAYSSLKALCEVLTTFAANNVWDKIFRITLVTSSHQKNVCKNKESDLEAEEMGTYVGKFWNRLFENLKIFNNFFLASVNSEWQMAVAEQIPILHRVDHSIHLMRIWVNEQCKLKSSQWIIKGVFQLLSYDVGQCLEILSLIDSQMLSLENADILMTVCISLREKLMLEINANIYKLKTISEGCISILSSVCRTLSLAHFSLSFPSRHHWKHSIFKESNSAYVSFVLDQMFLPAVRATEDITILELILKLVCEAWIDYIYTQQIKFSTGGALALLNDFLEVKEWLTKLSNLPSSTITKLLNHEVLHMCKGVGKVLLRKPNEIIQIICSPKHQRTLYEGSSKKTELPSEMFVSNQRSWLQLKLSSGKPSFSICGALNQDRI